MRRKTLVGALSLLLVAAVVEAGGKARTHSPVPEAPGPPPLEGILLVTLDTTRADHLSCYGYPYLTSPNVDRLASEGTLFRKCWTTCPITGPAHASLLTSLYPQSHGAHRNGVAMNAGSVSLAQILKGAGWRTAAFVSAWTLRGGLTGLDRGFDTYDEEFTDHYRMVNSQRFADQTTDVALRWLSARPPGRFLLWVHYFDPHEPYRSNAGLMKLPPAPGRSGHELPRREPRIACYDSEIAFTDRNLGRLLGGLQAAGIQDRTLVVVVGDHGEAFGEHGVNGHGRRVHEPGVHVPLVMHLPGVIPAGKVVEDLVSIADVFPTVLDLLGSAPPAGIHGRSMADLLGGAPGGKETREIYAVAYPGTVGHMPGFVRKWFGRKSPDYPLQLAIRRGDWKFVWEPDRDRSLLYDLATDAGETRSILGKRPDFESWKGRLKEWYERTRGEEGKSTLSDEDLERLRSLGYADPGGR